MVERGDERYAVKSRKNASHIHKPCRALSMYLRFNVTRLSVVKEKSLKVSRLHYTHTRPLYIAPDTTTAHSE